MPPVDCQLESRHQRLAGFSLVELLVVISILAVLVSLLLPAVQQAREAARLSVCRNHLRQVGVALHIYQAANGYFPPSFMISRAENGASGEASWSIHARLLPYLEQSSAASQIDIDVDWHDQVDSGMPAFQAGVYQCPSEPSQHIRFKAGRPYVAPTNYGFNLGTWLIYDPRTGASGDGPFIVNGRTRPAMMSDGFSNTLAVAEVRSYQPYIRNTVDPGPELPAPTSFHTIRGQPKLGPDRSDCTGHTVWSDGRVHHTGVTVTFTPNAVVTYTHEGRSYDIDLNSRQEGKSATQPTYAAVTSRSHHANQVNALLLDGSARGIHSSIDLSVWRRCGTRTED